MGGSCDFAGAYIRWAKAAMTLIDQVAVLALNHANERETSPMDREALQAYIDAAFHIGLRDAGRAAFMIALDQSSLHDGINFSWFRARHPRFVYVDRIVVAESARGQGYARHLYDELIAKALEANHTLLCCEVNVDPPNAASLAFHTAMGFTEVGRAALAGKGKTVAYLVKALERKVV
jgi:uncharacterized protein